jgi:hypothetical protein
MIKKTFQAALIFAALHLQSGLLLPQSTFEFLGVEQNARAGALAGSFVANGDDANVIFYNPAGISQHQGTPVSFSYTSYFVDISSASLAVTHDFGIGRFSAGLVYFGYGDMAKMDEYANNFGDFGAHDMAFLLGYGSQMGENFYYGLNAKFIYSGIDDYTSTGLAFDLGLQYVIPESQWNFGFSVLNLGSQLESYGGHKEDLPLDMRLGFSKRVERTPFMIFFSFNRLNEDEDNFFKHFQYFTGGAEIILGPSFKLRLGYDNMKRKDMKVGGSAGLAGISGGVGIKIKDYNVDYGYSSWGLIGGIHRFSISTAFN